MQATSTSWRELLYRSVYLLLFHCAQGFLPVAVIAIAESSTLRNVIGLCLTASRSRLSAARAPGAAGVEYVASRLLENN